ncbi:methylmalonyl-CoA mutase family protein [Nocardioides acrostichi]|uniref:Methylmalonyl-CoA mutase n=1 Tax=Nocardioides acrostichi TaxID=2784339 RepID=A0A930V0S3_9ACTN|nr:methylmalonyl-CoA mutase family protein [Nocardioides acrostichi]MBF4161761.1 methylmalonyl-CoA mutase [Nocardioides acrostichi]
MTAPEGAPTGEVEGQVDGGLEDPSELEPEQGSLDLASPDDDWTIADWEKSTATVLRKSKRMADDDADDLVWAKLTKRTLDGVEIAPLGTAALLERLESAGRPARAGDWDVRSLIGAGPAEQQNEFARVDLEGGVTSLWVQADQDTDLAGLLEGVLLDLAPVVLDAPTSPVAVAEALLALLPDGDIAVGTNLGVSATAAPDDLAAVAKLALDHGVLGVVVDGTAVHDRGASDVTELGWVMAAGARVLRVLERAGISITDAAGLIELRLAATDEQFPTIAKLRAARRLWSRVLELSGAADTTTRIHAVTSRPMMTRYDPYVNMLRTTVAAFAAGVGGADSVTVLPFDAPLGRPEAFGRRIARNTSHLLIDESHVAHVADPAGGAYAIEKLTDDTAVAAWEALGRLDGPDGPHQATLDEAVEATCEAREQQVATRKRPITGVSEFPNLAEELPEREPYDAWVGVESYAASFEQMRDSAPSAPVFLATLGSIAAHTARATFATNLLAAGGVAVEVAGASEGPDDLVRAYAGQPVVCLAGTDPAYAEWGEAAATALREAGAERVLIAGRPVPYADDSCAMGVDALAFLTRTREALA